MEDYRPDYMMQQAMEIEGFPYHPKIKRTKKVNKLELDVAELKAKEQAILAEEKRKEQEAARKLAQSEDEYFLGVVRHELRRLVSNTNAQIHTKEHALEFEYEGKPHFIVYRRTWVKQHDSDCGDMSHWNCAWYLRNQSPNNSESGIYLFNRYLIEKDQKADWYPTVVGALKTMEENKKNAYWRR